MSKTHATSLDGRRPLVLVEGQTDEQHLRVALNQLKRKGLFEDLQLEVQACENDEAVAEQTIRSAELRHQDPPVIGLVDHDSAGTLRKLHLQKGHFHDFGNNVIALSLVPPDWLEPDDRYCIEFLYRESERRTTDAMGRRLYETSEFDSKTSSHRTITGLRVARPAKTLIREEVYNVDDVNVALSKQGFANLVASDPDRFTFDGFVPTLELITEKMLDLSWED